MPNLQIIGAPQSNFVWACRIACGEKAVPYELVAVFPHTPEVDAIHPFGKIPAMRHGDVTLCESRAILYYIDHAFSGAPLAPRDPVGGAKVEQWISLHNTAIDPLLLRQYGSATSSPARRMAAQTAPSSTRRCPRWSRISRCSTVPWPTPDIWSATL
jgi:glutathione S-transferase